MECGAGGLETKQLQGIRELRTADPHPSSGKMLSSEEGKAIVRFAGKASRGAELAQMANERKAAALLTESGRRMCVFLPVRS